jgi:hypothetical protein
MTGIFNEVADWLPAWAQTALVIAGVAVLLPPLLLLAVAGWALGGGDA